MAKGHVALRGRFSPGVVVALVRVDGEHVLRAAGGETVERKKVDADGCVEFEAEPNARYFVTGIQNGFPLEVRVRGRAADEPSELLGHAPVAYERKKLADGSWADEEPEKVDPPPFYGAPHLGQQHLDNDVIQRSNTIRGSAHPFDPDEPVPYPRQEDVGEDVVQRSSTETGMATPIPDGPARQEDVPDNVVQSSATATGVATVLPTDAVEHQEHKESAESKALFGEPGKVPPAQAARARAKKAAKSKSTKKKES